VDPVSQHRMKALITGASAGIGRDMAHVLARRGFELILVARREELLDQLKSELSVPSRVIALDLSDEAQCRVLYEQTKDDAVDILINNAGFGLVGPFDRTDLGVELDMIDVNIRAVHILTKLYLKDFVKRDSGYILNVASLAAVLPGPLMATYYASKAYVLSLTQAIWEELRQRKSHVHVSVLCPGPVPTDFNKIAQAHDIGKGTPSAVVAEYAVDRMLKNKRVIVPGLKAKLAYSMPRLMPMRWLLRFAHSRMIGKGATNE